MTTLDEHGFEVPKEAVSKYLSLRQTRAINAPDVAAKWDVLLEQAAKNQYRVAGPLPPHFAAAVREGIPDSHRGEAWMLLTGAEERLQAHKTGRGSYGQLLAEGLRMGADEAPEVEASIDRDLHRTFPGHPALTDRFLARIKNVLVAYSARNPEVAYCP